jgi:hypothetical protein
MTNGAALRKGSTASYVAASGKISARVGVNKSGEKTTNIIFSEKIQKKNTFFASNILRK